VEEPDNVTTIQQAHTLKVLTVKQPWATMLIAGIKTIENRTFRTRNRGTLAIHAAARVDREGAQRFPDSVGPTGVVLGTVEVLDCVRDADSPWAMEGYWHWVVGNACAWESPVAATGRLGLWTWTFV
jgi:hypothetical protein